MQELEKLGKVMSVVMDNCDDCPLERICSSAVCYIEWKRFCLDRAREVFSEIACCQENYFEMPEE